jgi:hypothetical protein
MTEAERDLDLEKTLSDAARDAFSNAARGDASGHALHKALSATGFLGLGIDEANGGSGGTARLAGLVAETAGMHATAMAYLPNLVAAHAAAACGDVDLVASIVTGATTAVVFFADPIGAPTPSPVVHEIDESIYLSANRFPIRVSSAIAGLRENTTWLAPDWHDVAIDTAADLPVGETEWPTGLALSHGVVAMAIVGLARGLLEKTAEHKPPGGSASRGSRMSTSTSSKPFACVSGLCRTKRFAPQCGLAQTQVTLPDSVGVEGPTHRCG